MGKPTGGSYQNGQAGLLSKSYEGNTQFWGEIIKVGRPRQISNAQIGTYTNSSGSIAQVSTISIGTAAVNTVYSATFSIGLNGAAKTVQITSGPAATATDIQTALLAALQSTPGLSAIRFAAAAGPTITATQKQPGTNQGFDLATSGGGAGYTAVETTAPSDPGLLMMGRLVVSTPADQATVNTQRPNSASFVAPCRYPASAGDVDYIVGFTIESEAHGVPFFGGPSAEAAIQPYFACGVMEQGEIGFSPVTDVSGSSVLHVYFSGPNAGRIRAGADGVITAPLSNALFRKFRLQHTVKAGEAGCISII